MTLVTGRDHLFRWQRDQPSELQELWQLCRQSGNIEHGVREGFRPCCVSVPIVNPVSLTQVTRHQSQHSLMDYCDFPRPLRCSTKAFPVIWARRNCLLNNVYFAGISFTVSSRLHSPILTHYVTRICVSESSHGTIWLVRQGCTPRVFNTRTSVIMFSRGHFHASGNTRL